jgi:hypothetical protein
MVTEEIDLDAEEAKVKPPSSKTRKGQTGQPPAAAGGQPVLPTSSPFELSEEEFTLPEDKGVDSSEDFNLTLDDSDENSPIELGSDEKPALVSEDSDEVSLDDAGGGPARSGINLQDPGDSGISLEQGGSDEMEFDIGLEPSGDTPRPASGAVHKEGSSEFELSLDDSDSDSEVVAEGEGEAGLEEGVDSSSEFELTLDEEDMAETPAGSSPALAEDSDSEFELTLDEEGGLAQVGAEEPAEGDKDIFEETDFDVPALDEESASEAVPLTDVDNEEEESSEFDLTVDEEEQTDFGAGEDEGGVAVDDEDQPVVSIDEEDEADAAAETVARRIPAPRRRRTPAPAAEDDEGLDITLDEEEGGDVVVDEEEAYDEEAAAVPAGRAAVAAAAPAPPPSWGPIPTIFLLPAMVVLFVVVLMCFEMFQSMWGYKRHAPVSSLVVVNTAKTLGLIDEKDIPKGE